MPSTLELYRALVIRMTHESEMLDNVLCGHSPWGHGPSEPGDMVRLLATMRDTRQAAEEVLKKDVIEVQAGSVTGPYETKTLEGE